MKTINFMKYLIFGLVAVAAVASCKKDDPMAGNSLAPVVTAIYLEDAQSSVPDRLVTFARLGQTIRLEGANLLGVAKVYINGYDTAFNSTLMSDNSMIVQINSRTQTTEADPELRDKITVEKQNGKSTTVDFTIMAAAPSIENISHTMAKAGEVITITGTNLHAATSVLFPGDIAGTGISSDDEDGEWVIVTVPAGITTSGPVKVTGANGTAESAPFFNFTEGMLHNFDDVNNPAWASGVEATTLSDVVIPAETTGPKSQGFYQVFNATGNLAAGTDQRYWLNSGVIGPKMNTAIDPATSTDLCGIQMDIYVDGAWSSGIIRMMMVDGLGTTRGCMVYAPTLDPEGFVNPGSWFTITMPFGDSADFAGKTLADVTGMMAAASYLQAGPWFDNSSEDNIGFAPSVATQKVYFDNIRIVPLEAPSTSDYPEEEVQQ